MALWQNSKAETARISHFAPLLYFLWFLIPFAIFALIAAFVQPASVWLGVGVITGTLLASWMSSKLDEKKLAPEITDEDKRLLDKKDLLDKLTKYVEGKVKRYWLLFGVNGGAFVIAKFLHEATGPVRFAGQLTEKEVALGAVLFTLIMTLDIWLWGWQMRRPEFAGRHAFTPPGRAIALLIGGLLVSAWILAALPRSCGEMLQILLEKCRGPTQP